MDCPSLRLTITHFFLAWRCIEARILHLALSNKFILFLWKALVYKRDKSKKYTFISKIETLHQYVRLFDTFRKVRLTMMLPVRALESSDGRESTFPDRDKNMLPPLHQIHVIVSGFLMVGDSGLVFCQIVLYFPFPSRKGIFDRREERRIRRQILHWVISRGRSNVFVAGGVV